VRDADGVPPAPGRSWLPAALTLAGAAAVLAAPWVLDTYSVNVLTRSLLLAVAAVTVDLLWGYTGILSFAQAAFLAIGAYALALVSTNLGFSVATGLLGLLLGLGAAGLAALLVGWLAFSYGASPLYVSTITLVFPIVFVQLIFAGGNVTGSSSGLSGFDAPDLDTETWFRVAGLLLVAVAAGAATLVRSDFGRLLVAMRENEVRCQYLGIPTARLKVLLFVACALVCAAAGWVYAGATAVVAPELGNFVSGTELVIYTALGGRATIAGPILGAVGIDAISNYLGGALPFLWALIVGLVFVVVIVALPGGLLSLLRLGRARRPGPVPRLVEAPAAVRHGDGLVLRVEALDKRFGSLQVLRGVAFAAQAGDLVSLIGPNGAGKTTLMRCIADGRERSAGTVEVGGRSIRRMPPHRCAALGVGRKFQTAAVFETMTVAECLRVARSRIERPSWLRRTPTIALPEAALEVVRATGLSDRLGVETRHLSHGEKQSLELAMVLALEPTLLLLDEPTAGLTKPERWRIGTLLADLAHRHRLCIVLVEHDLDFVRSISSRVIVLHQGRVVLDGAVEEAVQSETVRTIYAGTAHA
jgi:branched-chain amino acid transport system permease protein